MKIFAFNNKSTKSNNSAASKLNEYLTNKIFDFAPYLKPENGVKKSYNAQFVYTPTKKTKSIYKIKTFDDAAKYILSLEWNAKGHDDYDFELSDGTPVKIHQNEVQIGYDFYPIEWFKDNSLLDKIVSEQSEQKIIDIAIKIAA